MLPETHIRTPQNHTNSRRVSPFISHCYITSEDVLPPFRDVTSLNPFRQPGVSGWSSQTQYSLFYKILIKSQKTPYEGISVFGKDYAQAADIQGEYTMVVRELVSI